MGKNKISKKLWLDLCIIIFVLFFAGCSKEENPTQPSMENLPFIMGTVSDNYGTGRANCWIMGDPVPNIDSVRVNSRELKLSSDPYQVSLWYSLDSIEVSPGSTYTLLVYHSKGEATASVTLPEDGDVKVVRPESTQYVLPRDSSDFVLIWNSVDNAGYYSIGYEVHYTYPGGYSGYADGFSAFDTTYTIPVENLHYLEKDTLTGWSAKINIAPMIGPGTQPGDSGNIAGEGYGFWWGGCETAQIDLQLEGVPKTRNNSYSYRSSEKQSMKDILKKLKEKICNP